MKVRVKDGCSVHVNGRPYGPGQEVTVSATTGRKLVAAGTVAEVKGKAKTQGVG